MLWPFVEQVLAIMLAEEYAGRLREARFANVLRVGPAGRAVGRDQARLPRAPDRHANRHQHGDKTAAARDGAAGVEHARRVGVEEEPPLEQPPRVIDRRAEETKQGQPKCELVAKADTDRVAYGKRVAEQVKIG